MKKKILSLILVLMLLPIASFFGACGKDDGYNLNNLQKDFNEIAIENNNVVLNEGQLEFDYSNHADVIGVINTTEPYASLEDYNYVFHNIMAFVCSYIDECSNNNATKNATIKNNVKNDLDKLSLSIRDVNECFDLFAEILYDNNSTPKETKCLERFENLIYAYETMYVCAGNFSNSLSNLYYNYVLNDGNPDVYGEGSVNFNVELVVNKFESRIKHQLSNLSQSYVEMYVGGDLAKKVAKSETTFDLTKYNYKENVEALNKPINSLQAAIEKANVNKTNFYDWSVQAQNLQATLNNDIKKFVTACNDIDYTVVKNDITASAHDKMCVSIVESYYSLVSTYNNVLVELLNIITNS